MKTTGGTGLYSTDGQIFAEPLVAQTTSTVYGVIFCHGSEGVGKQILDPTIGYRPTVSKMVDSGLFRVLAGDLGAVLNTSDRWSTDANLAFVDSAFTYLTTTGRCRTDKVHVHGGSLGGMLGINWTARNITKVKSLSLVIPLINLTDVDVNNRVGLQAQARSATAWNGVPDYATRDPLLLTIPANWPPTKIWYASDDSVTVTAADNQTFINRLTGSGHSVRNMGAVGHTYSAVDPAEVLAFMQQNS